MGDPIIEKGLERVHGGPLGGARKVGSGFVRGLAGVQEVLREAPEGFARKVEVGARTMPTLRVRLYALEVNLTNTVDVYLKVPMIANIGSSSP